MNVHDENLEFIVALMSDIVNSDGGLQARLGGMLDEWHSQRAWAFGAGCVDLKLDEYIGRCRRDIHLLCQALMECKTRLVEFGDSIDIDRVRQLLGSEGVRQAKPVAPVIKAIDELADLLHCAGHENRR